MFKQDLAWDNPWGLIYHKILPNQNIIVDFWEFSYFTSTFGDALCVMFKVEGNGINNPSSNPEQDWLHFTSHKYPLEKTWIYTFLSALSK